MRDETSCSQPSSLSSHQKGLRMNIAGLRNKTIKAWVQVDDEVKVLCNYLPQQEWEELKKEATLVEVIDAAAGTSRETLNQKTFRQLVGRRVVVDVAGLTDGIDESSKEPLPFQITPENIDLLMEEWTEFRLTILGTPMILKNMLQLQAEQEKKNS